MKKQCDLVVIGGGGSGLIAGCRAATLGKTVMVLEKDKRLGGGMVMASTMRTFGSHRGRSESSFPFPWAAGPPPAMREPPDSEAAGRRQRDKDCKPPAKSETIDSLKRSLLNIVEAYPIRRITLFGSRADGTNREDSDVDLIIEFSAPITLMTISRLRCELEELLGLGVDIIHGPIQSTDMIEIGKVVELYAA